MQLLSLGHPSVAFGASSPQGKPFKQPQITVAFRIQLRYTLNKPSPTLRDIVKENI